jgi:phospholipid/cholesterol/gamma-HCH transport system ATP-binding protein
MPEPLLELHRICLVGNGQALLHEVSLTVHEREIVGLVFQHGIGKTSLLRIGAGLLRPTSGEVIFRGQRVGDLDPQDAPFGFVFRDGGLLGNLSLRENLALPLRYHTQLTEEAVMADVEEALRGVGLEEQADKLPFELPRDAVRLATLARDLMRRPSLVFIDDFFRGGDLEAFRRLEERVVLARKEHGTSFLLVLEPTDGFGCADRLCLVDHGAVLETLRPPAD